MSKITLGSERKLLATHYRCLTFDLFFSKPLVEEGGPVLAGRSKSGLIYYCLERNPSLCIDPCPCENYSSFPSILCYVVLTSHTRPYEGSTQPAMWRHEQSGKPCQLSGYLRRLDPCILLEPGDEHANLVESEEQLLYIFFFWFILYCRMAQYFLNGKTPTDKYGVLYDIREICGN